jgi:hypothetical protein
MHGIIGMAKKAKDRPLTAGRIVHIVREVERSSQTGGTGFTILKATSKPIRRLLDEHAIGPEEFQAVQDIERAFFAMTGALMIRPLTMERLDRGRAGNEPVATVDSQRRYQAWADHWSMLAKRGDKTLAVVIAAVIDERAFRLIEDDFGLRHGLARKVVIRGLRDYAARAGWAEHGKAALWKAEAGNTFRTRTSGYSIAVSRARFDMGTKKEDSSSS